jgi:hypothetical protein
MVKVWKSYCDGFSLREIAKQFGIHNSSIFRALRKMKENMTLVDLNKEPHASVIIRAYDPNSDAPFVFASWRNSVWFDTHTQNALDPRFFRIKTKEIRTFLDHPDISTRIACLNEDPDQIIGYAVLMNLTIEFVYVKQDYRNQGIATLLTKGFQDIAQPSTKIGSSIARNHKLKIKENEVGRKEEIKSL